MQIYRTSQVFVPGGMPSLTYVPRAERKLEDRLRMAKDNFYKLVTVTGATKSGKTVLVNTVFPRDNSIWVDGGAVRAEDDFWNYVLEGISGYTELATQESKSAVSTIKGDLEAEAGLPLIAKGRGSVGGEYGKSIGGAITRRLSISPRSAAISQLRSFRLPLIIDDFHYLDRNFQGNIIRAPKPLIFDGLPVVVIAIPHRRYDAIKVEREMTGRLEAIDVPTWEPEELLEIAIEGFPLLNIEVSPENRQRLADEAYGSPHLMQEFCKALAVNEGISETAPSKRIITSLDDDLFINVAEGTGKVVFDKLAKGPRQRADRIQRPLKSGKTADIYKVTLLALAKLKPGLETIEYEQLRSAIKDVLADRFPSAQEVTRVLEKMTEIATADEASTPVLDWEREEQKLHITDPFFAFYLKWGMSLAQKSA